MNLYIIVEGAKTEMKVYPEWLKIIAPELSRINNINEFYSNNYLLFSSNGIPLIYNHVANAAEDINQFNKLNSEKGIHIDYLIVCIDTEEESREYILHQIESVLRDRHIDVLSFQLEVFEQKVCMETWFLGNRKLFKANPEDLVLRKYISHYNVRESDPEEMENIDDEDFSTKAQFHHSYLRRLFAERNIKYSKNNPGEVCKEHYLKQLIERYKDTGHIGSFGRWLSFISRNSNS